MQPEKIWQESGRLDRYVEDGHNMFDLIPVFVQVFEQSGYITSGKDAVEGEVEKN